MTAPTVAIEFWQLVTFLVGMATAFFTATWAFAKVLLKQLDDRFKERDQKLNKVEGKIDQMERDVLRLRAELPNEYVRREDWIRFSGSIDTKLDWLREKGEATRLLVEGLSKSTESLIAELLEQVKAARGQKDDR